MSKKSRKRSKSKSNSNKKRTPKLPPPPSHAAEVIFSMSQKGLGVMAKLDKFGRMLFLPKIRLYLSIVLIIDRIIIFLANHWIESLSNYANNVIVPVFHLLKVFPYDVLFQTILWFGFFNDIVTAEERLNKSGTVDKHEQKKIFRFGMFKALVLLFLGFNFQGIIRYEFIFFSIINLVTLYIAYKVTFKMSKKYGSFDFNEHMKNHRNSKTPPPNR